VYALLVLVFLVLADWGLQTSGNAAARDADLVYCLGPARLDGFVNAAVSLGLAGAGSSPAAMRVDGRKLSLAEWHAEDSGDFQRTCDAFAATAFPSRAQTPGEQGGFPTVLTILLPVVAGALITMAADDVKEASNRRWAQADELRADWRAFESAIRAYVRDRQRALAEGLPPTDDLDAKRRTLAATLRKIHSQHRKSPNIRTLQSYLDGGLGSAIADGWGGSGAEGGNARVKQITHWLSTFGSSLEKVAGALERRIWLSSRL
jgi:hypothetical protein